jgi:hypothetical protein
VIGNQMIQIIKDSAFLTIIALPELTHAASLDSVAALRSVRGFHHRGVSLLGPVSRDRGRRQYDRPAMPKRGG